jgi:Mn-containing catalase
MRLTNEQLLRDILSYMNTVNYEHYTSFERAVTLDEMNEAFTEIEQIIEKLAIAEAKVFKHETDTSTNTVNTENCPRT